MCVIENKKRSGVEGRDAEKINATTCLQRAPRDGYGKANKVMCPGRGGTSHPQPALSSWLPVTRYPTSAQVSNGRCLGQGTKNSIPLGAGKVKQMYASSRMKKGPTRVEERPGRAMHRETFVLRAPSNVQDVSRHVL